MFSQLKSLIQRMRGREHTRETKNRGPVPPNRVPTGVLHARQRQRPQAATSSDPAAGGGPANQREPRILSRGNNKNVYVELIPGDDENEALRAADNKPGNARSALTTSEEDGCDPYNSGIYDKSRVWGFRD